MRLLIAMCVIVLATLAGCTRVVSKQPLYTARDRIVDPALVGKWCSDDGKDVIVIATGADRTMTIESRYTDNRPLPCDVVRIGKYDYVFGQEPSVPPGTELTVAWRFRRQRDALEISLINGAVLAERLGQLGAPVLSKYESPGTATIEPTAGGERKTNVRQGGTLTLTDSPERIRQYLAAHENDPQLFSFGGKLTLLGK